MSDFACRLPYWISAFLGACPTEPTCSDYARAAISRYRARVDASLRSTV